MGLTSRLILLALIVLAPAIAVQVYNAVDLRREREAEVHDDALRQARLAASEISSIVDGVRNLLTAVSAVDAVRTFDADRCVGYLATLRPRVPQLSSIVVVDGRGLVQCRYELVEPGLRFFSDNDFLALVEGSPFVVGEYRLSPVTRRPVLPLLAPLRNDEGALIGAVVASLALDWLNEELGRRGYPPGGSVTVADRNGIILARVPESDGFLGTPIPEAFQTLVRAEQSGTLELTSRDGTRRVLGYVPTAQSPHGLYVSAGLSAEQAFAAVRTATWRSAVMLAIALVGAVLAVLVAGRIFISRPVDRLLASASA